MAQQRTQRDMLAIVAAPFGIANAAVASGIPRGVWTTRFIVYFASALAISAVVNARLARMRGRQAGRHLRLLHLALAGMFAGLAGACLYAFLVAEDSRGVQPVWGWDGGLPGERPRHRVWLPEFAVSRQPVTNAEYDAFVAATGAKLYIADERERFLTALDGVTDPETKRKIIGREFIRAFEAAETAILAEAAERAATSRPARLIPWRAIARPWARARARATRSIRTRPPSGSW